MFCPKCGIKNPESGKFCRSCGTNLGNVSNALANKPAEMRRIVNHKGKPITLESAITKFLMGIAFLAISIILGTTGAGRGWWFWMLIPALMFVGSGIAQYLQLKSSGSTGATFTSNDQNELAGSVEPTALPPTQTEYVPAESRYKTGDLVPPSVTDTTTKHLEINSEGETMTLPKL